jgi:hypothetical protein
LRTIPGQTQKYNIEKKNIDYPPQLTPWPN